MHPHPNPNDSDSGVENLRSRTNMPKTSVQLTRSVYVVPCEPCATPVSSVVMPFSDTGENRDPSPIPWTFPNWKSSSP